MHLLRGREAILGSKAILDKLAHMSDQPGASDDLAYHLSTQNATDKIPCLVLVPAGSFPGDTRDAVGGFVGAALLFEYKLLGLGTRLYASADTTGRRALIAPGAYRMRVAAYVCRYLLAQGAEVVMTSVYEPGQESFTRDAITKELEANKGGNKEVRGSWSLVMRNTPSYLPLAQTFEATLASIGKKTRANLRYYRRRAEKELGCTFVPNASIGIDEFLSLNKDCAYAVTDELARWRYDSMARIERPFLHGIRDGNNRWLSLVSGRLTASDQVVLEWQCNRVDLPDASLSTVMRSYLIEHEVGLGRTRLYIEGGTVSSLQKSFVVEGAAELTMCRRSAYVWLMRKLAGRFFPWRIYLAQILRDPKLVWTKF